MPFQLIESIYRQHRQGFFTLALSITGCRLAAEDAVHQSLTRLNDSLLADKQDAVAFVYRCVRNASIDAHRRRRNQNSVAETIFNGFLPPPAAKFDNPDSRILTAERDQILRQAIDELAGNTREIVLLKTFSGLTFAQIGNVLDIPPKTAATQYRRALQTLHEKLKGQL